MADVAGRPRRGGAAQPGGPGLRGPLGGGHRRRADRGRQRGRRRPAAPGGGRRRRDRAGRRGPLLLPQLLQGHRPLRGADRRRHQQPLRPGRLQQLAPVVGDEAAARGQDARPARRQDHVRHPLPDVAARLPAGEVGRRRRAHRQPHRRAPHDPDGPGRHRPDQRARRPRHLRPRGPRHRRPRAPRPGHRRRPALVRHGRRRADDPALRVVVRRQRAARQDRPRPAAGGVRRLGVAGVPLRAVHADRHHRPRDRQEVARLRRLPERVRQDQPRDDAVARRPGRPLPRGVLRRRHRLAVGRATTAGSTA